MKKLLLLLISISSFAFTGANVGSSLMMATIDTGYGDVKMNIPSINGSFSGREGNFGWEAKVGLGLAKADDKDEDGDEWTLELDRFIQLKGKYFFQENFYGALVWTDAAGEACLNLSGTTCGDLDDSDVGFHVGYLVNDKFELYGGQIFSVDGDEIFEICFSYSF